MRKFCGTSREFERSRHRKSCALCTTIKTKPGTFSHRGSLLGWPKLLACNCRNNFVVYSDAACLQISDQFLAKCGSHDADIVESISHCSGRWRRVIVCLTGISDEGGIGGHN